MESIKDMVDVNTVVGEPVESPDGSVIVPVSRVTFGFTAGGGEYGSAGAAPDARTGGNGAARPFAGGSGAGVSVQPVGFLVVGQGTVRMLPVTGGAVFDRVIDLIPMLLAQVRAILRGEAREERSAEGAAVEAQKPVGVP
ncbi:MAG: GerW family sporulation protein [Firmicutes bacterium]|jgi:sporulation protein YtfJ|nr:GerW family sporulation protein [Bacillota bacterium]